MYWREGRAGERLRQADPQVEDRIEADRENFQHFREALTLRNRASILLVRASATSPGPVLEGFLDEVMRLNQESLAQARLVRDDVLEQFMPGASTEFRDLFQRGIELEIEGTIRQDAASLDKSWELLDQWGTWYNEHLREMSTR